MDQVRRICGYMLEKMVSIDPAVRKFRCCFELDASGDEGTEDEVPSSPPDEATQAASSAPQRTISQPKLCCPKPGGCGSRPTVPKEAGNPMVKSVERSTSSGCCPKPPKKWVTDNSNCNASGSSNNSRSNISPKSSCCAGRKSCQPAV